MTVSNTTLSTSVLDIERVLADLVPVQSPLRREALHPRELSSATSHDDLLTAILGASTRPADNDGPLRDAVDAQITSLRRELGIAEPLVVAAVAVLPDIMTPAVTALNSEADESGAAREPTWRKLVSGLRSGMRR